MAGYGKGVWERERACSLLVPLCSLALAASSCSRLRNLATLSDALADALLHLSISHLRCWDTTLCCSNRVLLAGVTGSVLVQPLVKSDGISNPAACEKRSYASRRTVF